MNGNWKYFIVKKVSAVSWSEMYYIVFPYSVTLIKWYAVHGWLCWRNCSMLTSSTRRGSNLWFSLWFPTYLPNRDLKLMVVQCSSCSSWMSTVFRWIIGTLGMWTSKAFSPSTCATPSTISPAQLSASLSGWCYCEAEHRHSLCLLCLSAKWTSLNGCLFPNVPSLFWVLGRCSWLQAVRRCLVTSPCSDTLLYC